MLFVVIEKSPNTSRSLLGTTKWQVSLPTSCFASVYAMGLVLNSCRMSEQTFSAEHIFSEYYASFPPESFPHQVATYTPTVKAKSSGICASHLFPRRYLTRLIVMNYSRTLPFTQLGAAAGHIVNTILPILRSIASIPRRYHILYESA